MSKEMVSLEDVEEIVNRRLQERDATRQRRDRSSSVHRATRRLNHGRAATFDETIRIHLSDPDIRSTTSRMVQQLRSATNNKQLSPGEQAAARRKLDALSDRWERVAEQLRDPVVIRTWKGFVAEVRK